MTVTQLLDALGLDAKHVQIEWGRGALAVTAPSGINRVSFSFARNLVNYYVIDQNGEWQFAGSVALHRHPRSQTPIIVHAIRTFLES